jgi:thiol-disulfide isomerase/thioredoxin
MRLGLALFLTSVALASCDRVNEPVVPDNMVPDTSTVLRRTILEEFTGHNCAPCPEAATLAQDLVEAFQGQAILVGMHVGLLASPQNNSNGQLNTDFRTAAGTDYFGDFGGVVTPSGMVGRVPYGGSRVMGPDNWGAALALALAKPAKMDLWFSALEHETAAQTITAELKLRVVNELGDSAYRLVVYLVEDSIVDWQNVEGQGIIPNYLHRHVLRDNLNGNLGTYGVELIDAVPGDTITITLSPYTFNELGTENWNSDHCTLVAYVRNGVTEEIEQAVERRLLE